MGGIAGSTIIGAKADPLVIYITVVATVNLVGLILKENVCGYHHYSVTFPLSVTLLL